MSLTKMSAMPFSSPSTRLPAALRKTMKRPSSEIDGVTELPSPLAPEAAALTCSMAITAPVTGSISAR